MKNLTAAADQILRSHGFTPAGQPIAAKPKKARGSKEPRNFVRIISIPMGGMTRRTWR
ncbi:MAG: hypothetical protein KW788_01480 [Candidatus Doudnabacteria bacterium]|nr:hypothetical protein [Candidatus Doudnabacteria bacterium]